MKLEQSDISLLFSNTSIPDAFFTEYLSQAPSDAVKVYLFLFFLSKYSKDIRINDLSKKLNMPLKSIQDSIKYSISNFYNNVNISGSFSVIKIVFS
mgnify:CR=1 FL=1